MNLFWKKIFGTLKSTQKIEAEEQQLFKDAERYAKICHSPLLEEYNTLYEYTKSPDFKEKKKIIQHRKYKDTEEYRTFKKLKKIEANKRLSAYFETAQSDTLKAYNKLKETDAFLELGDKKKVAASEELTLLKKFEKSKEYKNYVRFHASYILQELEKLKEKSASKEFQKSNEFWANPHRWKTTSEYTKEQRFFELSSNEDIQFFLAQTSEKIEAFTKRKITFFDTFRQSDKRHGQWHFGFFGSDTVFKSNYSFANEQQANNSGNNTEIKNGHLTIKTKKEEILASAWHPTKGFVEQSFHYTSDVLQTADNFRQQYGTFSVKLRCEGKLHHAVWLGTEKLLPHINIFHFDGKHITVGNATKSGVEKRTITGLDTADFLIYTLEWSENRLTWYVNNIEVFSTTENVPQIPLYMGMNSFIPQQESPDIGLLQIDKITVHQYQ